MAYKEKVYDYVELSDEIPIQKLSLLDQLRVLFKKITFDKSAELKSDDVVTTAEMQLRSDLMNFLIHATEKLVKGEAKSVTMSISSKFEPVLDDVLNLKKFTRGYIIEVEKPRVMYDINYSIKVTMTLKEFSLK